MFLGIGALVNPQAIALTKANAYRAAQVVLGTSAPQSQAMKAAVDYTNFIAPKLSRAATVQQILGDLDFTRFVTAAKEASDPSIESKILKAEKSMDFGLSGHVLGLPNWLLYSGLGAAGYFYYKKKKSGGGFKLFSKPLTAITPPKA